MPGWEGAGKVPADGQFWPVTVAAELLGMEERDLRDLIRITGLRPAGTMNMRAFRSQGRASRAYDAKKLITIHEAVVKLTAELAFPESP